MTVDIEQAVQIADAMVEEAEGAYQGARMAEVPLETRRVYTQAVDEARGLRDRVLDLRDELRTERQRLQDIAGLATSPATLGEARAAIRQIWKIATNDPTR